MSAYSRLIVTGADISLQNVAALLTVGGWTGSRYFSTAVGSVENRTQFARALLDMVDKYNLDGIDIEYVPVSVILAVF